MPLESIPTSLQALIDTEFEGPTGQRMDEVGDPIRFHRAFAVKTSEQLAQVLEFAAEESCVVTPMGAATSSGSFKHLTATWLAAHQKKGVVLVRFPDSPDSEFSEIVLDESGQRARVGAAVSIAKLTHSIETLTEGRLVNPMTITTNEARLVATFVGSGGVSDYCRSMSDLMDEATWMDGSIGADSVRHNTFKMPSTYFDYGSYKRVDPDRIPLDMSGRGGPFGIGLHVGIRLEKAPLSKDRVVIHFNTNGDKFEVYKTFLDFISHVNRAAKDFGGHLKVKPRGMEIMDRASIQMLAQRGKRFPHLPDTAQVSLIMDLIQDQEDGELMDGWEKLFWLAEEGIFPSNIWDSIMGEEGLYSMVPLNTEDAKQAESFRLDGPDQARWFIKHGYGDQVVHKTSTDFAVAAWEQDLVIDYGMQHFALMESIRDRLKPDGSEGFLPGYGHAAWRFDPHGRLFTPNKTLYQEYVAGKRRLGEWIVKKIREGRSVRVRGEKPEQPGGLDAEIIASGRLPKHVEANKRIYEKHDPHGLFMHRDANRK